MSLNHFFNSAVIQGRPMTKCEKDRTCLARFKIPIGQVVSRESRFTSISPLSSVSREDTPKSEAEYSEKWRQS